MKRTVNRTPGQISTVVDDGRTDNFNLISFEGIADSENDLTVSPSTFIDANNLYINSDKILSSRPTIKATSYLNKNEYIKLDNIKDVWVVDDLMIYHEGTKLKLIKNGVPVDKLIEVGDEVKVLESMENYILVYPANIYIDTTSKNEEGDFIFTTGPISDICYIPTTELRSGSQITNPEKPNVISPFEKHTVVYDKKVYTDLSEFYGKKVDVLIGNKTYTIDEYKENDINTLQGLLTVADFDYVKYSEVGSAIGVKNGVVYYASNGVDFKPLPTAPGVNIKQVSTDSEGNQHVSYPKFTGEVFITEEGDAAFIVSDDHIYAISLLEASWNSTTNSVEKRWKDWTALDWDTQYRKLTKDSTGKLTETKADMTIDSILRLNLINCTKPDQPRPYFYSKNFARLINENTFVIYMYAGDLDIPLSDQNAPSNYIKPTIFVYNRQVDNSKVAIYQLVDGKTELSHLVQPNHSITIADLAGGDFSLFGNIMMMSCSYRYAKSYNNTAGTAVSDCDLSTFVISVGTDGAYTYRSGQTIATADNLTDVTLSTINGFFMYIGDLKINYASFNPGMNSGDYTLLNADINFVYTEPLISSVTNAKMILRKYTLTEKYGTENSSTVKSNGETNFVGISSQFTLMSRSSLRIAVIQGLIVTSGDLTSYEFIPYRTSEMMKPIYIDEDTLITEEGGLVSGYVSIKDNKAYVDWSDETIIRDYTNYLYTLGYIKVTIDNYKSLNIKLGVTAATSEQSLNNLTLPSTLEGYINMYIVNVANIYFTNQYYTTDNIVATFSTIVENENFVLPDIDVSARLTEIYFGSGKQLYIGSIIYDKDEQPQLYFSEGLWEEFEETIFQLQILSKDSLGVYCRDSIWIVYKDDQGIFYKAKSKISSSCRQGDSVALSMNGEGSLYPCHRGIAYIEHQSLLSVEEQKLSFITDEIQSYMVDWIKGKPVKMFNYQFWLYVYSVESTTMWIMDLRNNKWWKWTTPYPVTNIVVYLNELYFVVQNKLCKLVEDDNSEYKDIFGKNDKYVIDWHLESQRLFLDDINRYKHIYNMVINSRVKDDEQQEMFMRLWFMIYRTNVSKTPDTVLNYKVQGRRSFVKKLNIFKCNFIKFKIASDTEDDIEGSNYEQKQFRIEGISIRYGVRGRIR